MERRDAQAFIDAYFGRFERVAQWIEETKDSTKERGYAEDPDGPPPLPARDQLAQLPAP